MIKVLEQEYLDDKFLEKNFISNIDINDRLYFSKENIYYFGNYKKEKLEIVKRKINKNKKNIINAVENNIKFIICGNSIELFNNSFNINNIKLFTAYKKNIFTSKKIKKIDNIKRGIDTFNFKYKNLICFK